MDQATQLFSLFREVGIIQQLSGHMFARRLPDGLHPSHFALLSNLIRLGDGKTPQRLASAFQVPKPTMTNTLAVLGDRGLIAVRPNPDDKRSKLVFATDAGRQFHDEAIAGMGPVMAQLQPLIQGVDIAAALEELQKLRQILDNNRDI